MNGIPSDASRIPVTMILCGVDQPIARWPPSWANPMVYVWSIMGENFPPFDRKLASLTSFACFLREILKDVILPFDRKKGIIRHLDFDNEKHVTWNDIVGRVQITVNPRHPFDRGHSHPPKAVGVDYTSQVFLKIKLWRFLIKVNKMPRSPSMFNQILVAATKLNERAV